MYIDLILKNCLSTISIEISHATGRGGCRFERAPSYARWELCEKAAGSLKGRVQSPNRCPTINQPPFSTANTIEHVTCLAWTIASFNHLPHALLHLQGFMLDTAMHIRATYWRFILCNCVQVHFSSRATTSLTQCTALLEPVDVLRAGMRPSIICTLMQREIIGAYERVSSVNCFICSATLMSCSWNTTSKHAPHAQSKSRAPLFTLPPYSVPPSTHPVPTHVKRSRIHQRIFKPLPPTALLTLTPSSEQPSTSHSTLPHALASASITLSYVLSHTPLFAR